MPKRIAQVYKTAYYIPVAVTDRWSVPAYAGLDIANATGFPIVGEPMSIIYDLYFYLWDGYDDSDNFATLKFDASVPEFTYKDHLATNTPWTTPPVSGNIAYIMMTLIKK